MTIIAERNHDGNGTVAANWTVVSTSTGLSITAAAALNGTAFGLEIDEATLPGGSTQRFRHSFAALSGNDFRLRTRVNFDNATNPAGGGSTTAFIYEANDSVQGRDNGQIRIEEDNASANGWNVGFYVRQDGQTTSLTQIGAGTLLSGDTCLELAVIRATSNVALDGQAYGYINGVLVASSVGIDNFDIWTANVPNRLELWVVEDATWGGEAYVDEVVFSDDSAETLCVSDDGFTAAPMKKPCDIDADGDFIYIAALDSNGDPTLIKFSTALDSDGEIVFTGSGGSDIGVETARADGDSLVVAGDFGTTYVQSSDDAGTTFTDITPSAGGAVKSFVTGPDDDRRILVYDTDNGDLLESVDAGDTWVTKNASVSQTILAMARLGIAVDQSVFGNSSVDAETVQYSPNTGADLAELSGGPDGVDVNGLIVNG